MVEREQDEQDEQEQPELIGWRIVDPYGNIVASGPVTVAEMSAETGQLLALDEE